MRLRGHPQLRVRSRRHSRVRSPGSPPETLSPAGRAAVVANASAPQPGGDLATRRAFLEDFQRAFGAAQLRRYDVEVGSAVIGGVPVRTLRPHGLAPAEHRVLINLHGGGFNADSGSLTENIPVAALANVPVVAVLYRLMPEHPFPAGVDDALAVYRELLKSHDPSAIGVYGTSAGAVLGPQLLARMHREGLPLPAVLGMFSGDTDLSRKGDSLSSIDFDVMGAYRAYAGKVATTDPLVSPMLGTLAFFPPTLCLSSSRDFYLSATASFCRRLEAEGVENRLVIFDGLPHAFWAYLDAPESDEAFELMARFLRAHLALTPR